MIVYKNTIPLDPKTKKNSQQIVNNGRKIIQSKIYLQYEKDCAFFIRSPKQPLNGIYNVKCIFYRKTKRNVDLSNLNAAVLDILVKYGVLEDDSYKYVESMDGSRVKFDKENPRTEIEITEV